MIARVLKKLGAPTLRVRGDLLRKLKRPCVYVWLRGDEVLYVGKGSVGVARPLGSHSHLRIGAIKDSDLLLTWVCEKVNERALEARLIKELRPKLNQTPEPSIWGGYYSDPTIKTRWQLEADLELAGKDIARLNSEVARLEYEVEDLRRRLAANGSTRYVAYRIAPMINRLGSDKDQGK